MIDATGALAGLLIYLLVGFRRRIRRRGRPLRVSVKSRAHGKVGLTGLEPVTLRLSSACSNQLSYRPGSLRRDEPRETGGDN